MKMIRVIKAKQYKPFGVFQYESQRDEIVFEEYFDSKNDAIRAAKMIENEPNTYTEVWMVDTDGTFGLDGEPIYKSDK